MGRDAKKYDVFSRASCHFVSLALFITTNSLISYCCYCFSTDIDVLIFWST